MLISLVEKLVILLLGGLLGATLIRTAPGFGVSQEDLDSRLSEGTRQALREERSVSSSLPRYYASYLGRMASGDLGTSWVFNRPVGGLIEQRIAVTAWTAGAGLLVAWLAALGLAAAAAISGSGWIRTIAAAVGSVVISFPAPVIGLLFLIASLPVSAAIATAVFPRLLSYLLNLFEDLRGLPHVLIARARGVKEAVVFVRHVLPLAAPKLIALAGVSVSIVLGVSVPIEVVCDLPGIGQLMWQAAQGRDLPVLVSLTLLVTFVVVAANFASELAAASHVEAPE